MAKSARSTNSFTVGVKLLNERFFHVVVGPQDTVAALKQRIFEREGIAPPRQNLLVLGKLLEPETRALSEFNLKAGDVVYVTAGKRGSGEHATNPIAASSGSTDSAKTHTQKEDKVKGAPATPTMTFGAGSGSANSTETVSAVQKLAISTGAKPASGSVPGTDVSKLRASTIQHFAKVATVLKPHADISPAEQQQETNNSRWPRASQAYCVYTRTHKGQEITGVMTFGLSNPYQTNFYYAIGIGIEIILEAPTTQARLADKQGRTTGASISDSWMFAIVHEIAHQCFALGLQIRQLLEKLHLLSVEIAGVTLPSDFVDPETGRCCVLLGHLGDPDVPRGFNVTVPHQQQWIVQSVLFVPARLLTFSQCQMIRKDGAEARRRLGEQFVKSEEFSVCDVPVRLWPKEKEQPKESANAVVAAAAATGKEHGSGNAQDSKNPAIASQSTADAPGNATKNAAPTPSLSSSPSAPAFANR